MNAKEGERWILRRADEMLDNIILMLSQLVILTSKWDYTKINIQARHPSQPISLQLTANYQFLCLERIITTGNFNVILRFLDSRYLHPVPDNSTMYRNIF